MISFPRNCHYFRSLLGYIISFHTSLSYTKASANSQLRHAKKHNRHPPILMLTVNIIRDLKI